MASSLIEVYTTLIAAALGYALFWFIISLILKRNDVADVAWGLGYVLLCIYLVFTQATHPTALLVYTLVMIWGIRLSLHIGWRNRQKKEDFRYRQWREAWDTYFYIRSFLQVYVLQVFILLGISTPIIIVATSSSGAFSIWLLPGILLWCLGFYWQALSDYQLLRFKKHQEKSGGIIQTGLWKYSRHPNYFGEICMWWGIGICVLPLSFGWIGLLGPILITFLLLKVSGVPMLEAKYKEHMAFQEYAKVTPAVFPRIQHLLKK